MAARCRCHVAAASLTVALSANALYSDALMAGAMDSRAQPWPGKHAKERSFRSGSHGKADAPSEEWIRVRQTAAPDKRRSGETPLRGNALVL